MVEQIAGAPGLVVDCHVGGANGVPFVGGIEVDRGGDIDNELVDAANGDMTLVITGNAYQGGTNASSAVTDMDGDSYHATTPSLGVDESASGADYNLTFDDVMTAASVVDDIVMTQLHNVGFADVATQAPAIDDLVMSHIHQLVPLGVVTGVPTPEDLVMTQDHQLAFEDVVSGVPSVGSLAFPGGYRSKYRKHAMVISNMMGGE